ncbi:helix-turn-helix domain-containing protein [Streptomyces sp. NRRL F-5123]|uniref:helix-turn-helix domain-containing protein n=1 Tax=Streptomyces sp. NRRL F-5123 TaxID=1463856 RepID=UPI0004E13928|nr:helix-turn-helix transcriptional regulator [Streptomyces sp. NRRL F-5123]
MRDRTTMYRLVDTDLFRQLMRRTGNGSPVTGRQLARAAGVAHGTVGSLLTGEQKTLPEEKAMALAQRLGVDLLVVFEPVCRSTTTVQAYAALVQPVEEASA